MNTIGLNYSIALFIQIDSRYIHGCGGPEILCPERKLLHKMPDGACEWFKVSILNPSKKSLWLTSRRQSFFCFALTLLKSYSFRKLLWLLIEAVIRVTFGRVKTLQSAPQF